MSRLDEQVIIGARGITVGGVAVPGLIERGSILIEPGGWRSGPHRITFTLVTDLAPVIQPADDTDDAEEP